MVLDRMILTTGSLTIQNVVLVNFSHIDGLVLLVFKVLSSVFQFYWWRKPGVPGKNHWPVHKSLTNFMTWSRSSSQVSLGHTGPNLAVILHGWSSSKIVSGHLVLQMAVMALDWLKTGNLWKSASSEILDGMKPNLVRQLLGWSPSKIVLLTINNTR